MPDFARIRTVFSIGGQDPMLSTALYRGAGLQPSAAEVTDAAARVRAFWNALILRMQAGWTVQTDGVADIIDEVTGTLLGTQTGTTPAAVTTTGSGDILPKQTQGLLRLNTAGVINGRRLKGRWFLPVPLESDNTAAGAPVAGLISTVNTAAGGLLTGGTPAQLVVWHRPNPTGGLTSDVTSLSMSPSWSVLKTRR